MMRGKDFERIRGAYIGTTQSWICLGATVRRFLITPDKGMPFMNIGSLGQTSAAGN